MSLYKGIVAHAQKLQPLELFCFANTWYTTTIQARNKSRKSHERLDTAIPIPYVYTRNDVLNRLWWESISPEFYPEMDVWTTFAGAAAQLPEISPNIKNDLPSGEAKTLLWSSFYFEKSSFVPLTRASMSQKCLVSLPRYGLRYILICGLRVHTRLCLKLLVHNVGSRFCGCFVLGTFRTGRDGD